MVAGLANENKPVRIEILGTPFNGLGSPPLRENPADGLRQKHLAERLASNGHAVKDLGDVTGFHFQEALDPETGIKDYPAWVALSETLSSRVAGILDREAFPLLLGGDCSMLVGIFSALARKDMPAGLIFLDGHADFNSPATSPNRDPADMELAVLTGRGPHAITHLSNRYPLLEEENIVVYGIRAWDRIAASPIRVYDRDHMARRGIHAVVKEGLADFIRKRMPAWLHFDVDVIDPQFMPVMFPEPNGLTVEETRQFLQQVGATCRTVGLSIACYHPVLDVDGSAGTRLVDLVAEALPHHA